MNEPTSRCRRASRRSHGGGPRAPLDEGVRVDPVRHDHDAAGLHARGHEAVPCRRRRRQDQVHPSPPARKPRDGAVPAGGDERRVGPGERQDVEQHRQGRPVVRVEDVPAPAYVARELLRRPRVAARGVRQAESPARRAPRTRRRGETCRASPPPAGCRARRAAPRPAGAPGRAPTAIPGPNRHAGRGVCPGVAIMATKLSGPRRATTSRESRRRAAEGSYWTSCADHAFPPTSTTRSSASARGPTSLVVRCDVRDALEALGLDRSPAPPRRGAAPTAAGAAPGSRRSRRAARP